MYKHKWVSNYKLALAIHLHKGLNHGLLQLLTFNPPERLRMESRNEAPCALT